MDSNTEVWKLILSFFLPPFIYTKLISFKSVLWHESLIFFLVQFSKF